MAFGRDYIANPDLVARLQRKAELNPQRPESFMAAARKATLTTLLCNFIDSGLTSPLYFEYLDYFKDNENAFIAYYAARRRFAAFHRFYTNVLGMKLLRTSENPEYKYSLAFVGYGPETEEAVIELTYNWGVESYDMGNAYGHIALSVDNAAEACERIRQNGGNVTREAGPVKAVRPSSPSLKIRMAIKSN